MSQAVCFLYGHRDTPTQLRPRLKTVLEGQILLYGIREFVVGQRGSFDRMAAGVLRELKKQYPEITLTLLIAYHPSEREPDMPEGFDGTFYPPAMEKVPRRFAIVRANEYMVRHCDRAVCYVRNPTGNTYQLLTRCERLGVPVKNLANG